MESGTHTVKRQPAGSRLKTVLLFAISTVAFLLPVAASAQSPVRANFLLIGQGWAVVREFRNITLAGGEQDVVLDGIPQEADLSTLMVLSRGVSIDLLQWQRVGATNDVHHAGEDASVGLDAGTGTVTWKPSCQPVPGGQGLGLLPVKCRVRSTTRSEGGGLYVIYTTTGLSWSAEYQVSIRGERTDEKEAMSVDLSGVVRILNGTVGNYPNAVVRLLSSGLAPRRRDLEAPGFLMLDEDSPLSDLWRPAPADSGTPFEYDLPARVSVQPGVETDVSLVRTLRTPASRLSNSGPVYL